MSQAGENSQIKAPEHMKASSILTYLTFKRNQGRRTAQSGPTIESAKQQTSSNKVQNSNSTQYRHKLPTQNFNLGFLGLKTKLLSQSIKSINQNFMLKSSQITLQAVWLSLKDTSSMPIFFYLFFFTFIPILHPHPIP